MNEPSSCTQTPPNGVADKRQIKPLRLELSLAEAWPWPGLIVRAAVRIGNQLLRLGVLEPRVGGFSYKDVFYEAPRSDTLIVLHILQLPTQDGIAFKTPIDRFAETFVLIGSASEQVKIRRTARIEQCRVLGSPPSPGLELTAIPEVRLLKLKARPYYYLEDGTVIGLPLHQTKKWACFPACIAPPHGGFGDPLLDQVFRDGHKRYESELAWQILKKAQGFGEGLRLNIEEELKKAADPKPLKANLHLDGVRRRKGEPSERISARIAFEVVEQVSHFDLNSIKKESAAVTKQVVPVEEVLDASTQGSPVLRIGEHWVRVEKETVEAMQQTIGSMAVSGDVRSGYIAENEQIPELIEWARQREVELDSPWNVYISDRVDGAHRVDDEPMELRLNVGVEDEGTDAWFTISPSMVAPGRALSAAEIKQLIQQRKKWLRNGKHWVRVDLDKYLNFNREAEKRGLYPGRNGMFRFKAEARERVNELFSLAGTVEHSEKYRSFVDRLGDFERVEDAPLPKNFQITLRPYQVHGYNWLKFLQQYGLNGILADDMGLGKTAQTLAMLSSYREEKGIWPSLIVCPTSLVDNWAREAIKFDPNLRVMRYIGSPVKRDSLRRRIAEFDIVLTTYATMRNDATLLKNEQWRYLILDEAHTIKNASANVTRAVKTIPARHRLALTGTPVQNRLDELWSLFDFLMPGFLGRASTFFQQYEDPISRGHQPGAFKEERENGRRVAEFLRERIKPFVLRRLKEEVARDLPEKIEQDIPCRLSADQMALYAQFSQSDEARKAVKGLLEKGAERSQAEILTALMALRKICNHPDLMHLQGQGSLSEKYSKRKEKLVPLQGYEERSGKLEALADLLDQLKAGEHRTLIFCQLTSMLDILEFYLNERGERFLRLDGSTPGQDRQALVDRYNNDPGILAFLISTRAGGAGLNLTGADTVIFYDHDWNPANDRQAQDRAYRIGQKRVVNVYRLVTQGTLEEKILERQKRKTTLAHSVVTHDVHSFKDLTKEELVSLFTFTGGQER